MKRPTTLSPNDRLKICPTEKQPPYSARRRFQCVRIISLIIALSSFFLNISFSLAQVEQTFPYKAFIATEEVYVRSGPGQNYYPTDKLAKGQEVEVYRHDPGGWCAIRPPEGSFSWVSSQHAKIEEGKLAVIADSNVSARVGSKFSDIRDSVQVRLKKGEVVEVLDSKKVGSGNSPSQTWYKISPPAGEFRWVSLKYLEPAYVHDGLRNRHSRDGRIHEEDSDAPGEKEKHPPMQKLPHEVFQAELDRLELELSQMVVEEPNVWSFDSLRIGRRIAGRRGRHGHRARQSAVASKPHRPVRGY